MPGLYTRALTTVVDRSAIPYGYTLTIWTSGAVLERSHGTPAVGDTLLFLIGAFAGFAVLALLSQRENEPPLSPGQRNLLHTGLVQILAVGVALGVTALEAMLHSFAAWPIGGLAATVVYLGIAALQLALSTHEALTDDDPE